jgi:hypothetical protein
LPALIGVGLPTDSGNIPVTFLDGGIPITVFVGGLHISDVKSSDMSDDCVDETLAEHAIKAVEEIVDCWNDYKNNIISNYQKSTKG